MGFKMFKTELFPYIDGTSLKGIRVNMVMDYVTQEKLPNGQGNGKEVDKYVLYFQGNPKGLVLNKTNVKRIIKAVGSDDTDNWKGKTICLFSEPVKAFGETFDAVRVGPYDPKAISGASTNGNGKKTAPPVEPQAVFTDEQDRKAQAALFGDEPVRASQQAFDSE